MRTDEVDSATEHDFDVRCRRFHSQASRQNR